MNVVDTIENFDINRIYFTDSQNNMVIDDGSFSKILVSYDDMVMNGIFLQCHFNNTIVDKLEFNKYRISWDEKYNQEILYKLKQIEIAILEKYKNHKQLPMSSTFINNRSIRVFSEMDKLKSHNNFLLRISGVWETRESFGITYKFLELSNI